MRSYTIQLITLFILVSTTASAFSNFTGDEEYIKLIKLERKALLNGICKTYISDLIGRKGCNKTKIKYLGIVHTRKGKHYKILTSFFVFSTASSCRGTSRIKIFDMQNKFIGEYNVGMPEVLPDILRDNKLVFSKLFDKCNPKKRLSINLRNGLPKILSAPCDKIDGGISGFSSGI